MDLSALAARAAMGSATDRARAKDAICTKPPFPRSRLFRRRLVQIDLAAGLFELLRFFGHRGANLGGAQRVAEVRIVLALGGVAHFLADLHRAEFRPTHGAEMR